MIPRTNGDTARITVRDGATTQTLIAEWAHGAWQSGIQRFAPALVTETTMLDVWDRLPCAICRSLLRPCDCLSASEGQE